MRLCNNADVQRVIALYSPLIYRLAFARTGNHQDAEDVCQDVFLTLAKKNPDFEAEENRRAWLIRVTVNRSLSLWRTPWKKKVTLGDESARHRAQNVQDDALADALAALNQDDRVLIHLFYFEGFKTDEIAAMLGRKHATVRTQLSRARKRLKSMLTEEG